MSMNVHHIPSKSIKFPACSIHVHHFSIFHGASTRPRNHRKETIALELRRETATLHEKFLVKCRVKWGKLWKINEIDGNCWWKWWVIKNWWRFQNDSQFANWKSGWTWPIYRSFTRKGWILELVILWSDDDQNWLILFSGWLGKTNQLTVYTDICLKWSLPLIAK